MSASEMIDARIAGFDDWRGQVMSQLRKIIHVPILLGNGLRFFD
jgi:hypothetical protein